MSEHFTPQGPYTLGGNFTHDNANNIENGLEAVDNAKANLSGAAFTGDISTTGAIKFGTGVSGSKANINESGTNAGVLALRSGQAGASALGVVFTSWDGSFAQVPFSVGGQFSSAKAWIDNSGNLIASGFLLFGAAAGGSQTQIFYNTSFNVTTINTPQAGAANGTAFGVWNGSAQVVPFSVGGAFVGAKAYVDNSGNYNGPAGGGIPMTRNGTAISVPIYTGTTSNPINPPTNSAWIKA